MESYALEQFLRDPEADIGTGLLALRNSKLVFTLKQPHRWGTTDDGVPLLPFGGIGGKLEAGESPAASLHREALEEVGSDVCIAASAGTTWLLDGTSVRIITLTTNIPDEPLPRIIFRSPRAEAGRKPYTNVLIYNGSFTSNELTPKDDPALVELPKQLLPRLVAQPMSIAEFQEHGGTITSRIELPHQGLLMPVGTAVAVARCLKDSHTNTELFA